MFFAKLLNGEEMGVACSRGGEGSDRHIDPRVCGHITKDEIKEALKKMGNGKAKGPDQIPVEVWKCLGEASFKKKMKKRREFQSRLLTLVLLLNTSKVTHEYEELAKHRYCISICIMKHLFPISYAK